MGVGEVWHVHHKSNEVKIVCSDTLKWNGYSQGHVSEREGNMVIQPGGMDTDTAMSGTCFGDEYRTPT